MVRLNFVVEGQTEGSFVSRVLGAHLADFGVVCAARLVRISSRRRSGGKGGVLSFAPCRDDIHEWMKQDRGDGVRFTTMLDLYALPKDFPGYEDGKAARQKHGPHEQARLLETRFAEAIGDRRFIPYLQVHEFEALLFANVTAFSAGFPQSEQAIEELRAVAEQFETPEHIDDGTDTAPSKRILKVLPRYRKPVAGPAIAERIGLARIRERCPHFNEWVTRLEQLQGGEAT